jgi:signal transduction histidine kinase
MFSGLRLRLTLLYALAALALVTLVGGGAYLVVARYFRGITDLALQHKMAHEFHALAAPIPAELAPADRDWSIVRGEAGLIPQPGAATNLSEDEAVARAAAVRAGDQPTRVELRERDGREVYEVRFASGARVVVDRASGAVLANEDDEDDEGNEEHAEDHEPATGSPVASNPAGAAGTPLVSDAELAAIIVLPLGRDGRVLVTSSGAATPLLPDLAALRAALDSGSDLRTVTLADGRRARLLTYRLTGEGGPAALQLGRVLSDQEQVLGQLTFGLLTLGSMSMVLVGVASWWLAGGALRPAQEAWERQQRFIASASHELRTPLTLIRASAEVALRGAGADADQRELLGDVLAESDHMRRLVDDLLTLSRLDSGRMPLALVPVELPPLLAELQRQVARLGDERGVAVAVVGAAGSVHADPERLRQVLLILLDNALRHTPAGGQVALAAAGVGRLIRLSVSDTGCGIAPEHLPHIFERFYRADPARGRESGNAGLGLAIASTLVEAMGGQIGATSTLGRGTTVWLTLPAA